MEKSWPGERTYCILPHTLLVCWVAGRKMAQRGLRYSSYIQALFPNLTNQRSHSFTHSTNIYWVPTMYHAGLWIDWSMNRPMICLSINQLVLMNKASFALLMLTFQEKRQPNNKQTNQYLWHGVRGMCRESIMRRHLSQNPKDICNLLWGRETGRKGVSYLSILKKESSFYFIFWQECGRAGETSFPLFPGLFFFSLNPSDFTMKPMISQGYICPLGAGDQQVVSTTLHSWSHLQCQWCSFLYPPVPHWTSQKVLIWDRAAH